ncbi:Rqc2 family fibronectin-binding protein [Scatolibacter rhodanostii]|uniref:Rqc2 family fibronectin-binding protein n=1 Tax=Scatolibacter rhodanostii TaxID=2014781 RepID=UPI000C083246|nr:NFACT RNA binding domain-containing protein [Scatolibacter rhodanostii]
MALDGAFLRHIKTELEEKLIGARADKIYQPNREEIIIAFRTRQEALKVLFSARANSARVGIINQTPENPKQPPMLCMLLRKKLQGARLVEIRQPDLERVLHFDFDTVNELGDRVTITLTMEIMGKYSNIIVVNHEGLIIDSLKRVDAEMSSQRLVLPGLRYQLPPPQEKLNILTTDGNALLQKLAEIPADMELSKALLKTLQGISPVVCREIQHQVGRGEFLNIKELDEEQLFRLKFYYEKLREAVTNHSGTPFIVVERSKRPIDFSFLEIHQYGTSAVVIQKETFSELLNAFFEERDSGDRMRVKQQDLLKLLTNLSERLSRKIEHQQAELAECAYKDDLRIAGDLLSSNSYAIAPGATVVKLQNFYDENLADIEVKLNPALSASQNAQKYYKDYRKAKTAENILQTQIIAAKEELLYIDSVFESLALAKSEQDLGEIRAELTGEGYIKKSRNKKEKEAGVSAPLKFTLESGLEVLVGRNNRQNDKLTMKTARKQDIWFHVKGFPGSHTVLLTEGKNPSEDEIKQAAALAAKYSRAKDLVQVAVDYTEIRHVTKPQGAKPGMVNYVNYKTIFVKPTE